MQHYTNFVSYASNNSMIQLAFTIKKLTTKMKVRLVGHSNWIPDTRHEPVAKSSKTLDKIDKKKCSIQKQSKHSKNVFINSSGHEHSCKNTNGCEACMKQLTVDCSLTTVMYVFRGVKKFECRECGKQFLHYSHLKTHKRVHTSGMIFKCDVCEKSFPETYMLETHRIIHQERHICHECGREFFLRDELSNHIWSHKRAVNFSCKVCGKLYNSIGSLNNHMQVHSIKNNDRCENHKCTGLNDCEDEKKDAQFSNIVRSSFNDNCENKYEAKMSRESFSDNHFQRQLSTLDFSAKSQSGTWVISCALPVDCDDGTEKQEVACQMSEKCSLNHKGNQPKESEITKTDDHIFIKQEVADDEFMKKKYVVEEYHFIEAQRDMKTEFGNTDFVKEEMNWELTVKDEDLGENV